MKTEYEATFVRVNKNEIRETLKNVGAKLVRPEFLQKRVVFHLPRGHEMEHAWARVRDEDGAITMSLKVVAGDSIENQQEICLQVDNFKEAEDFLLKLGCHKKAYQENKRELWTLSGTDIMIDEWPFLEPFVEIESTSEKRVRATAKKLGFDYSDALFCSVGTLYSRKYNIPEDVVNNQTPKIIFAQRNPFLRYK